MEQVNEVTPARFTISVHDNGYYQVSIPNYYGGEVVKAEAFDALVALARVVYHEGYLSSR